MITGPNQPVYLVVARTFDNRIRKVLDTYKDRISAEAHAQKFNDWHNTHGREQFAFVQPSDEGKTVTMPPIKKEKNQ